MDVIRQEMAIRQLQDRHDQECRDLRSVYHRGSHSLRVHYHQERSRFEHYIRELQQRQTLHLIDLRHRIDQLHQLQVRHGIPLADHLHILHENEENSDFLVPLQLEDLPPEDKNCPICLEEVSSPMSKLFSGHFFHLECIQTWLGRRNTCPRCRRRHNLLRVSGYVRGEDGRSGGGRDGSFTHSVAALLVRGASAGVALLPVAIRMYPFA